LCVSTSGRDPIARDTVIFNCGRLATCLRARDQINGVANKKPAAAPTPRGRHNNRRADLDPIVEVDHVFVGQPDATRRNREADIFRLVRAMDAE
jgi:hypothetical protein